MARQAGPLFFTGTIDDITFYKMEGVYLARKKSSLTRKQFRTDPRFARSRKSAEKFGEASKLASQIYWQLPKEQRGKGVVNRLTGQVGQLLKEGKSKEEIIQYILPHHKQTAIDPPIHSQLKEHRMEQDGTSAWKVTKKGQLIVPKMIPTFSIKTSSPVSVSTALHDCFAPQRE